MTEDGFGYLVTRHGLPTAQSWEPGQRVEQYKLLAPLPAVDRRPTPKNHRFEDVHALARTLAPQATALVRSGEWVPAVEHRCTCKRRERIATEYQSPEGRFVIVHHGDQLIPPAFRHAGHDDDKAPSVWPLHAEPEGPHLELTNCRRCRRVWAVALTWRSSHLIPLEPRYGVRVTE